MASVSLPTGLLDNPTDELKKIQEQKNKALRQGMIQSGAQTGKKLGDALGNVIPGVGNIIGGAAGTLLGAGAGLLKNNKQQQEIDAQQKEAISESEHQYTTGVGKLSKSLNSGTGFKKGGKIKGKGTAKSDSIKMNAEPGSFVVPAENAEKAYNYGKDYLGWDDNEVVSRQEGNKKVNVSNGEVIFTPDEANALSEYGIDLNELAPNADPGNAFKCGGFVKGQKLAEGGPVDGGKKSESVKEEKKPIDANDPKLNEIGKNRALWTKETLAKFGYTALKPGSWTKSPEQIKNAEEGDVIEQISARDGSGYLRRLKGQKDLQFFPNEGGDSVEQFVENKSTQKLADGGGVTEEESTDKENKLNFDFLKDADLKGKFDKLTGLLPEIASGIQIAAGVKGLKNLGEQPDINVSKTLAEMTSEAKQESEFGLPSSTKQAIEKKNELSRRRTSRAIAARGGSPLTVMQSLQESLGKDMQSNLSIELADLNEKNRKKSEYRNLGSKVADSEREISLLARDDYQRNQDIYGELVSAGIKNIIGARQYKAEAENIKEINS